MPLNALRNGALSVVVRCPARCGQVMTVLEERVNEVGNLRVRCGGAGTVCRARTLARLSLSSCPRRQQNKGAALFVDQESLSLRLHHLFSAAAPPIKEMMQPCLIYLHAIS